MTIKEDRPKCKHKKFRLYSSDNRCNYVAVTEGGYCKIHDPVLRKARESVKRKEYNEQVAARIRASQEARDRQAELERKAVDYERVLAGVLHYPHCWDTTAYPNLDSAIVEAEASGVTTCQECE